MWWQREKSPCPQLSSNLQPITILTELPQYVSYTHTHTHKYIHIYFFLFFYRMANQQTWLLIAALGMLKILGHRSCTEAVVLPRPPSSELQAYSFRQNHQGPGSPTSLVIVTSSELPKQIPPPTQPLTHSSTPQYHEVEQQMPGLPQLKLLWVTRQMDRNSLDLIKTNLNAPPPMETHKNTAHRTDLLPNMI